MTKTTQNNSVQNSLEATRTIPEALQGLVIDLDTASDFRHERFLLSFDGKGKQQVMPVPFDACVMTQEHMLRAINEPNGLYVSTEMLADFAVATVKRLKSRRNYYQTKGDIDRAEAVGKAIRSLAGELL